MNALKSTLLYFLATTCLLTSPLVYAGRPNFPAPPQAKVEWVSKNMQVNGIPTAIRAFHTQESIEQVIKFYRREWQRPVDKGKPGFMETIDAAPWYIISRIEDDYL